MKVAFITSGYLPLPASKGGAVETLISNLIYENEKSNNKFYVFSIYTKQTQKLKNTNFIYIKNSFFSMFMDHIFYFIAKYILKKKKLISYKYFFQRSRFMRKCGKHLHKENYDKVILENNVFMFKAIKYKNNLQKYKDKIYYHAHNELGKTLGYDKYLYECKKIISISNYIKKIYDEFLENKIENEVLLNTIDTKLFNINFSKSEINKLKEKYKIKNNKITILYVGRLDYEKGILHLLKALKPFENYNLLIVGASFYATKIKTEFEKELVNYCNKLKGNVIFTGYVNYKEIPSIYKIADFCVLPSVWNEPCGLTILEAVAAGIPIITSNRGGIPEVAASNSIIIDDIENVEKLSDAINYLLTNSMKLEELKKESLLIAKKQRSISNYYDEFIQIIKD